ncbi:MAG: diaminopimelate epimerase [Planctomycetota bacterium]|nr:diaminopimelate epimerase [Planctomycetota bacterium]
MRFTKMHGCGNDYIYVEASSQTIDDPPSLAVAMADRHVGIGADGLILILDPDNPEQADLRMRIFNADGSEAEMCGNGIRCVCKYAHDRNLTRANPMRIETEAGELSLQYTIDDSGLVDRVSVDMGEPILSLPAIPVLADEFVWSQKCFHGIELADACWNGVFVSMGNPHLVLFANEHPELMAGELAQLDVAKIGSQLENHQAFPQRMNIHFVQVVSPGEIIMRTWERGSGITQACGTGACAVCVAGVLTKLTDRTILAHLPGGDLELEWDEASNHVLMTGPAVEICTGQWSGANMREGVRS